MDTFMEPTAVREHSVEVQVIVEAACHKRGSSTSHSCSSSNLSPNLSDPSLPIEASDASAGNLRPRILPSAPATHSLAASIPHTFMLRKLHKDEKRYQRDASEHNKGVQRLSNEIYMIVSGYVPLQLGLFAAVAQSTTLRCVDWWGPVWMAVAAMLGMLCSVVNKLRLMGHHKQLAKTFERRQSAVYDQIELLHSLVDSLVGYECPDLCPQIELFHFLVYECPDLCPQISSVLPSSPLCCWRGLLVLGFLIGFSLLVIASCTSMLCQY